MNTAQNVYFGEFRSALQEPTDEGLERAEQLMATLDLDTEEHRQVLSYALDLISHWDEEWIELLPEKLARAWGMRLIPQIEKELARAIQQCQEDRVLELMCEFAQVFPDIRGFGEVLDALEKRAGDLIAAGDERKLSKVIEAVDTRLSGNIRSEYESEEISAAANLTYRWLASHAYDYNYADADTTTWWLSKALEADPHDDIALMMYMNAIIDTDYRCTSLDLGDIAELIEETSPERALELSMLDAVAEYIVCVPFGARYIHVWANTVQYCNEHGATPERWQELLIKLELLGVGPLPEAIDDGWWEAWSQGAGQ